MARIPAPVTLKGKALQLLATRDYSRAEMERKLAQWLRQRAAKAAQEAAPTAASLAAPRPHAQDTASAPASGFDFAQLLPQPETEADIANVLDAMQAKGFLSDSRAAEALLHRRAGKLGNSRLQQELRQKGLDADTVEQAMAALPGTELERARAIWRRKFGTAPQTPAERLKHMRFLASRGFGFDVARQVLSTDEDV